MFEKGTMSFFGEIENINKICNCKKKIKKNGNLCLVDPNAVVTISFTEIPVSEESLFVLLFLNNAQFLRVMHLLDEEHV